MDISYHFWFVYTLIGIYLFIPILRKIFAKISLKEELYFFLITILPTTIAPFINKILGVWVFKYETVLLGYIGYFTLGHILGKYTVPKKICKLIYILAIIAIIVTSIGTYSLSTTKYIDSFFNGGYQWNIYIIATAVFIFLKNNIPKIKNQNILSIIEKGGAISYEVYLSHALILFILQTNFSFAKSYQAIIFNFINTLLISFLIAYVLDKVKNIIKLRAKRNPLKTS